MRPYLQLLPLLVLTSGALLVGESTALAQQPYYGPAYGPPPPPPGRYYRGPRYAAPYYYGAHSHDGLFIRLAGGFGFLSASESVSGSRLTYSGFGLSGSAALGGAIAPNLILFGEVLVTSAPDADRSSNGYYEGSSGNDLLMFGVGPGLAYYIEPANAYLSATLGFTQISFVDTASQTPAGDTDFGFGMTVMIGKEWWIGPRWGLGLAGQAHLASMRDPYFNTRMSAASFSLLCSATFN